MSRISEAIRNANPNDHKGTHICVDGRRYMAGGTCLVTDTAWQKSAYADQLEQAWLNGDMSYRDACTELGEEPYRP